MEELRVDVSKFTEEEAKRSTECMEAEPYNAIF